MTDYTQMTDEELATAVSEGEQAQYEHARREWRRNAPLNISWSLIEATSRNWDRAEIIIEAINITLKELDPGGEHGPEGDIPIIDDAQAQEIIDALQARINAV